MSAIAERLKSERKRLGLTQKQISEAINIGEASWNRYEKYGVAFDTNVICALQEQGFNMPYVIFGILQYDELDEEQHLIFKMYQSLDDQQKIFFQQLCELFKKSIV